MESSLRNSQQSYLCKEYHKHFTHGRAFKLASNFTFDKISVVLLDFSGRNMSSKSIILRGWTEPTRNCLCTMAEVLGLHEFLTYARTGRQEQTQWGFSDLSHHVLWRGGTDLSNLALCQVAQEWEKDLAYVWYPGPPLLCLGSPMGSPATHHGTSSILPDPAFFIPPDSSYDTLGRKLSLPWHACTTVGLPTLEVVSKCLMKSSICEAYVSYSPILFLSPTTITVMPNWWSLQTKVGQIRMLQLKKRL